MFSFLSREDPTLQLYGKLPIAKDYLRIGCAEGAGRRLREWMDRSFSALEVSATQSLAEPMSFLWPDGSRVLLGTIWPSSDAGGLRPFPFVLCVERKWRALWDELESGMGEAERWLRSLDQLWDEAHGRADGAELLAALRGKRVGASPDRTFSLGVNQEHWAGLLWPDSVAGLERLLTELVRADSGRRDALVLPMTRAVPLEPQLDAWWSVMRALGRVSRKAATTLFFSRAGPAGESLPSPRLILLTREPAPGEVAWLASHPANPSAARTAPDQPPPSATPGPSLTLAESLCGTLDLVRARST